MKYLTCSHVHLRLQATGISCLTRNPSALIHHSCNLHTPCKRPLVYNHNFSHAYESCSLPRNLTSNPSLTYPLAHHQRIQQTLISSISQPPTWRLATSCHSAQSYSAISKAARQPHAYGPAAHKLQRSSIYKMPWTQVSLHYRHCHLHPSL